MPALQTVYSNVMPVAFPGMVANTEELNVISRTVETAAIPIGRAVVQGATDMGCRLAADATGKFVGITIRDQAIPFTLLSSTADTYPVGNTAGLITMGVVWVTTGETVAPGDLVYFVPTTGVLGKTATSNIAVPRARWESSITGAGLAKLRIIGIV